MYVINPSPPVFHIFLHLYSWYVYTHIHACDIGEIMKGEKNYLSSLQTG